MERLEIGQRPSDCKRSGLPEQLPLLWGEPHEAPAAKCPTSRAASERDAVIERETRQVRAVVLTLLGAILLVSHFL